MVLRSWHVICLFHYSKHTLLIILNLTTHRQTINVSTFHSSYQIHCHCDQHVNVFKYSFSPADEKVIRFADNTNLNQKRFCVTKLHSLKNLNLLLLFVYFVVNSTGCCLFFIYLGVKLSLVVCVCTHDYIKIWDYFKYILLYWL